MYKLKFVIIPCLILLLAIPAEASAQRTCNRQAFIGMSQYVSAYAVPSGGLGLEGGQYLLNSYWKTGVRALDWNQRLGAGSVSGDEPVFFDHVLWTLHGGWMLRVLATYGRGLNVYLGASAFLGVNQYEVLRPLPAERQGEFPAAEFVYGAEPAAEVELFISTRTAVTLGVQSPFTFLSSLETDLWHLSASLGIRINL